MEQMERCVLLSTKLYLPQKVISDLLTYFVHHRYFAEHLLFFIQSTCFNRSCCLFDCRWYYKTNKENSCINKRTVFLFLFFPYHFLTLPLPLLPYLTPFSTLSPVSSPPPPLPPIPTPSLWDNITVFLLCTLIYNVAHILLRCLSIHLSIYLSIHLSI